VDEPGRGGQVGRWAVYVAVVLILYAATRWAWALGIPLGISEEFLRRGTEDRAVVSRGGPRYHSRGQRGAHARPGPTLGRGVPTLGSIPLRQGVPIPLAVVPASLIAVLVAAAGLMFVLMTLAVTLGESFDFFGEEEMALSREN
jgi:hypothetical protein